MAAHWQRCRDVCAGEVAVKARGRVYLPVPSGMDRPTFEAYLRRACLYPAASRTVAGLVGVLTTRGPRVHGITDAMRARLDDITLTGMSLTDLAAWLVRELIVTGRAALVLDRSETGGSPYLIPLSTERLVNWRVGQVGNDPSVLTQAVLREDTTEPDAAGFAHRPVTTYREYRLIDGAACARVWTPSTTEYVVNVERTPFLAGPWLQLTRRGQSLPFIPVTIVGARGLDTEPDTPPIEDVVGLVLSHFANSADCEHGLHYTALPTPWVSGLADASRTLRIGPSIVWVLSENGKAGMLEFSGSGLAAIRDTMTAKERAMSIAGSRLLLEPASALQAETATASKLRWASETASLRSIADGASQALTQVIRQFEWWEGFDAELPLNVRVEVAHDQFAIAASPDEIKTLLLLLQSDSISYQTFYRRLQQGGWTRDGVTAEQEQRAIQTGQPMLAALPDADLTGEPAL